MKKYLLFLFAAGIFVCCKSGGQSAGPETAVYDEKAGSDFIGSGLVESIEIIPLETTDSSLIGMMPLLAVENGEYFVGDFSGKGNYLRFDRNGKFLNTIGRQSSGPGEYVGNPRMYTFGDKMYIFSGAGKNVLVYSLNGDYIETVDFPYGMTGGAATGDGYWIYTGYGNGQIPERAVFTDTRGEVKEKILPSEAKIISVGEMFPVFVRGDGRLLMRETFNNIVYGVAQGKVDTTYIFDFGRYNVPEEYFRFNDPMAAGEFLFSRDFAVMDMIFETEHYSAVRAMIQHPGNPGENNIVVTVGIKDRRKEEPWRWFNSSDQNDIFAATLQGLTEEGELLFVVEAHKLLASAYTESPLFKNKDVLKTLKEDDNPVILKCKLK